MYAWAKSLAPDCFNSLKANRKYKSLPALPPNCSKNKGVFGSRPAHVATGAFARPASAKRGSPDSRPCESKIRKNGKTQVSQNSVISTCNAANHSERIHIFSSQQLRNELAFLFRFSRTHALCTLSAAVTIALLDSTPASGSEYSFAKKSLANFSTQRKNLCYHAGLILLQKILFAFGSRAW